MNTLHPELHLWEHAWLFRKHAPLYKPGKISWVTKVCTTSWSVSLYEKSVHLTHFFITPHIYKHDIPQKHISKALNWSFQNDPTYRRQYPG